MENCHRPYCCNETSITPLYSSATETKSKFFDKNGFCMECGITESGIEPVLSPSEKRIHKEITEFVEKIRKNKDLSRINEFNYIEGTFQKLLNPDLFFQQMFPGSPSSVQDSLPKSLHELLRWDPFYNRVKDFIPKILKSASEVLENVKIKGRERGDIMDQEVEKTLSPQISLGKFIIHIQKKYKFIQSFILFSILIHIESLAREIILIFRNMCKKASSKIIKQSLKKAVHKDKVENLDILYHDEFTQFLEKKDKLVYFQNVFLGPEWNDLLRKDLLRFLNNEKLVPLNNLLFNVSSPFFHDPNKKENCGNNSPLMSFLQMTTLPRYPALYEVIKSIHELPYEINGKDYNLNYFINHQHFS